MLARIEQAPEGYLLNETTREGYYALTALQKLNYAGWVKAHKFADANLKHILAWKITSTGRRALRMA